MPLVEPREYLTEEHDWGVLTWHTSGKQDNTESLTTGLCRIRPGKANPRHYHPNCEEVLHVLEGTIDHTLGSEQFRMTPGDTVSIPENTWHNATNVGGEDCLLLIAFSTDDRQTVGE